MKNEINFYEVDESIAKALGPLLSKIIDEGKKALVFCENEQKMLEIDKVLWSFARARFIPHITINDHDFVMSRQPVLLTYKLANDNNADYLVFLDDIDVNFIKNFPRVFHFYENHPKTDKIKPDNHYQKVNGKWIKKSD